MGVRLGNWLTAEDEHDLYVIDHEDFETAVNHTELHAIAPLARIQRM